MFGGTSAMPIQLLLASVDTTSQYAITETLTFLDVVVDLWIGGTNVILLLVQWVNSYGFLT
jgi:hypothetical protein